ncbi:MAG TPA: hypothetical protein VKV19_12535 [Ktedonobacteraceae bacterium]|nr:hypothetical protein [Ktedonobacteraceae bacterium]
MHQIGRVKQVQVQPTRVKQGKKPHRFYDPSPLLVTAKLLLTREGVIGLTAENEQVVDVHNAAHPDSRNTGMNGVSFGFTSHYRAMRARFGRHVIDGCAGENILIEAEEEFALEALGRRLTLQSQENGMLASLDSLAVAAPCVEFSHFVLDDVLIPMPAEILRETLIFLDHGRRGFYATFTNEEPFLLQAGDKVFVEES